MVRYIKEVISSKDIIPSPEDDFFEWPTLQNVRKSQHKYISTKPEDHIVCDQLVQVEGKLWIPEKNLELQMAISVISHCGSGGH